MSISFEPYLFVSSVSPASMMCMQAISQSGIPFRYVRLDTKEAREAAISGPHFSIDSVPTLVVLHNDGNMQMLKGKEKIIQWTAGIIARLRQPPPPPEQPTIELPKKKKKKAKPSSEETAIPEEVLEKTNKSKKKVHFEEEEISTGQGVEYIFEGHEKVNQGPPVIEQLKYTTGSHVNGKKNSADLLAAAKKMAEQRKESLGYE